jgi:hypothetical protein
VALGCALIISGVCFALGALLAQRGGAPEEELRWFYLASVLQILAGLAAPFLDARALGMHRSPKVRFVIGATVIAGAVFVSSRVAAPGSLPGIALGWPLLFHVERGAAIVAAIGLIALVLWRGANNEWPSSFGNLFGYDQKKVRGVTLKTFAKHQERISELEFSHGERLSALEKATGVKPPD